MLILGIDDAGRGPLIGPMIFAGVLIEKKNENKLKNLGVKDSKLLIHSERIRLSELIKKNSIKTYIVKTYPKEIDECVSGNKNLNTLEAEKMAQIINAINDGKKEIKIIIDCPSVNVKKWREKLMSYIKKKANIDLICEHKADVNYPVVSSASILAKVEREEQISKLKNQYGEIGSGYPSDPLTIKFLKEKGLELRDSGIFRKSWLTWKKFFPEHDLKKGQKTINDFINKKF